MKRLGHRAYFDRIMLIIILDVAETGIKG